MLALHINGVVLLVGAFKAYLHVLAGNMLVDDLDRNRLIPTDYIGPLPKRIIVALVGALYYD